MGTISSWVGGELHGRLRDFCRQHDLGWVLPADAGYQCFPGEPARVRKPDVSFIRFGRLPGEQLPEGHARIAPDLAVEVVSPNDLALELDRKVKEYLAAGVRLVWVIFPETRSGRIHRANGSVAEVRESDPLEGEDVIPGFRCTVGDLLPPASVPAEAKS
jgi:Uma2 family endonuclease